MTPRRRAAPGPCSQRALREMVAAAAPGDLLLLHYSGHGVQVRAACVRVGRLS